MTFFQRKISYNKTNTYVDYYRLPCCFLLAKHVDQQDENNMKEKELRWSFSLGFYINVCKISNKKSLHNVIYIEKVIQNCTTTEMNQI